jgi:hypothetical protein
LLPDRERVLGPDHLETLSTRSHIAHWAGEGGDAREALRLFKALVPDQERVLGADDVLSSHDEIARWTREIGQTS